MPDSVLRERVGLSGSRSARSTPGDVDVVKSPLSRRESSQVSEHLSTNGAGDPSASDVAKSGGFERPPHTRSGHTSSRRHEATEHTRHTQAPTETSSAWLDAPLALALLPTLGSFITGGEHIRDFFLLLLLLYYLHMLIKMPWDLYTLSRTRRRPVPPVAESDQVASRLVQSELRLLTLFYLGLTMVAPVGGAMLLRVVSAKLMGGSVSWFSTMVFILAAGIRPWRHLVELLRHRTLELQAVVQNAPLPSDSHSFIQRIEILEQEVTELKEGNQALQTELSKLQKSFEQGSEELEKLIRRQGRKNDTDRQASNIRIEALESKIDVILAEVRSSRSVLFRRQSDSILGTLGNILLSLSSPVWRSTPVRDGPARGYQRSVRRRNGAHNLTRIPEESTPAEAEVPTALPAAAAAVAQGEWYERALYHLFAPVRQLRALLLYILRTLQRYFFP